MYRRRAVAKWAPHVAYTPLWPSVVAQLFHVKQQYVGWWLPSSRARSSVVTTTHEVIWFSSCVPPPPAQVCHQQRCPVCGGRPSQGRSHCCPSTHHDQYVGLLVDAAAAVPSPCVCRAGQTGVCLFSPPLPFFCPSLFSVARWRETTPTAFSLHEAAGCVTRDPCVCWSGPGSLSALSPVGGPPGSPQRMRAAAKVPWGDTAEAIARRMARRQEALTFLKDANALEPKGPCACAGEGQG
jgi:hypothetical protein